jgi:hypothetical protein
MHAWAGGVEESEESQFCLFSVVFFLYGVSPRFYFRKHAFCFLPLVAILESPNNFFLVVLRIKPRASHMLSMHSTTELHPCGEQIMRIL